MFTRRPNWFDTRFSTTSLSSEEAMIRLVLYPALDQSFFNGSPVFPLFRRPLPSRRLGILRAGGG